MSERGKLASGIIILLIMIGGLFYWFTLTRPIRAEIELEINENKIEPINKDLLKDKMVSKLKSMDKNGEIPIKVEGLAAGRENPFQ